MKIKLNSIITVIEYLFSIFMILSLNSVYFCEVSGRYKNIIIFSVIFFTFLLSSYGIYRMYMNKVSINKLLFVVLIIIIYIGSLYIYNYHIGSKISIYDLIVLLLFPLLLLPVLYYQHQDDNHLLLVLRNIIVVISGISLIGWGLNNFGISPNSSLLISWGTIHEVTGYFGVSYFSQGTVSFLGVSMQRNTGIFVEAPMFAYVLIIALAINLFIDKKNYKISTLLIIFTIISSTSSTALIMLLILIVLKYYVLVPKNINRKVLKFIFSFGILFLVLLLILFILENKKHNMTGSYNLREDDIQAGIESWKLHPLMGNGLNNSQALINQMDSLRWLSKSLSAVGYSSGIFYILSSGGLYLTLMYVLPIFLSLKSKNIFILQIINFILLINIIVPLRFLCIFIIMLGIGEWLYEDDKKLSI